MNPFYLRKSLERIALIIDILDQSLLIFRKSADCIAQSVQLFFMCFSAKVKERIILVGGKPVSILKTFVIMKRVPAFLPVLI